MKIAGGVFEKRIHMIVKGGCGGQYQRGPLSNECKKTQLQKLDLVGPLSLPQASACLVSSAGGISNKEGVGGKEGKLGSSFSKSVWLSKETIIQGKKEPACLTEQQSTAREGRWYER